MLLSRWHAALGILFSSQTFAQTSVTLPWDPTGKNNCAGSGDCGESNIGIYCLEAYQRYDNNSRYSGYTSFVSNGRNGQGDGCTAIYRCRSSSDYGDGLTGFELKEAFSIIRGSAGCGACGSHLLQNPNCSVTLNACHSCKDSGTAAAVAVPEAQIASSSFLYYGISARSPDTSLVALNVAGAAVTTTAVNTSTTVITSIQNATSTLITSIAPSNTTSSSITSAPVPPFQNTTSMSSSTSSSSLGTINATIPSINMTLPFNSTPTSTTTGATVYLPLTGPLSNATSPPVGPYANSTTTTTTTSSSSSTSNSSSSAFSGNGNFLPGASPSPTPSPTTPSSSPLTISNPGESGQPGAPGSPPSGTVGGAGGAGGLGGGITSNSSTASPTTTLTVPPPGQVGQPGQPGQPGTPGSGTLGGAGGAGGAGGLPGGAATSSTPLPGAAGAGPVPGFAGPSREAFVEGGQAGLESSASVVTVTVSVCTTVTVGVVETVCV